MGILVRIDPELCIGSAECVRLAPALFAIDETRGVSEPLPAAGSADPPLLSQVAGACPMQAITLDADLR
ncbi:MAG TPA: ferredoxin [Candidatus Saccharimonadales bacterium]|nr:ferredoxin [Candidatus Saccharimonadales bacterium]